MDHIIKTVIPVKPQAAYRRSGMVAGFTYVAIHPALNCPFCNKPFGPHSARTDDGIRILIRCERGCERDAIELVIDRDRFDE